MESDNGSTEQTNPTNTDTPTVENESNLGGPTFEPPLYRQRYSTVTEILKIEGATSVADIGCAECKALTFFRNIPCVTRLIGVDIDQTVLESHKFKLRPLTSDYLYLRDKPLTVQLLCGDTSIPDNRIIGIDAVTMIELIEHLEQDTLDKVPETLFGVMRPRIVIITTPNSEFNILFPNFTGMRHWDHKFEWTREEFQTWCDNVASTHGYQVEYDGIGDPPERATHLGHCSQMAIFRRKEVTAEQEQVTPVHESPYIEICTYDYPHAPTGDKAVVDDVEYYLRKFALQFTQENDLRVDYNQEDADNSVETQENVNRENNEHNSDSDFYFVGHTHKERLLFANVAISFAHLLKFQNVKKHFDDTASLRDFLVNSGYDLALNPDYVIYPLEVQESDEDSDEEGFVQEDTNFDNTPSCSNNSVTPSGDQDCEENWDESEENETFEPFRPVVRYTTYTAVPLTNPDLAETGQFSDCDEDVSDTGSTEADISGVHNDTSSIACDSDINFFLPEYFMLKQQSAVSREKPVHSTEAEQFFDDL